MSGSDDAGGGLDATRLLEALQAGDAQASARIALVRVVDETTSTQSDALAAPVPAVGCAVFLAERQRAGVGRHGRHWVSDGSNLAMSLSRRLALPLRALQGLSLAMGVAVVEALHALGVTDAGLKWPNDLVAGGRKLGGLLVDARANGEGSIVVVGIGINIALAPDAGARIDQPWCDLGSLGHAIPRETVAAAVVSSIARALDGFEALGFAAFSARWSALDAWVGRAAVVTDGQRSDTGTVLGVDADGALRLATDAGERRFHAGELSLRPA